jgi:hypothetical protein
VRPACVRRHATARGHTGRRMRGHDGDTDAVDRAAVTPLRRDAEAVLAPVDANDRWGRAVRERLTETTVLTPGVGDALALWGTAKGSSPTKTWLRRDDELRERLPDGQVPDLAALLLMTFLDTTLADGEWDAVKARHAAAYELLRTMRKERVARQAGDLRYLGAGADGPVAAWAANVNPRLAALPKAVKQGELFGAANGDLLRGAVWAAARRPSDPSATAALLGAVVEHGIESNRGLEPGAEVVQAGKVVNAAIAMLATLPDRSGRVQLEQLQQSITNGHHTKHIDKALAALTAG